VHCWFIILSLALGSSWVAQQGAAQVANGDTRVVPVRRQPQHAGCCLASEEEESPSLSKEDLYNHFVDDSKLSKNLVQGMFSM